MARRGVDEAGAGVVDLQVGEEFVQDGVEFAVTEANDRRVLRVRVRRSAQAKAG